MDLLHLSHRNSYANQLYPGLVRSAYFRDHIVLSIGDCSVQRQQNLPLSNPCAEEAWVAQVDFIKDAISNNPSIKYVIIAGIQNQSDAQQIEDLKDAIRFV